MNVKHVGGISKLLIWIHKYVPWWIITKNVNIIYIYLYIWLAKSSNFNIGNIM